LFISFYLKLSLGRQDSAERVNYYTYFARNSNHIIYELSDEKLSTF